MFEPQFTLTKTHAYFSDGTVMPRVRGGSDDDGDTGEPLLRTFDTPQQIADGVEHLSDLTPDELAALETALVAVYQEQRETAEQQVLDDLVASLRDVRAEQTTRQEQAAEREAQLADLDREVLGTDEQAEGDAEGDEGESADETTDEGTEGETTETKSTDTGDGDGGQEGEQAEAIAASAAANRQRRGRSLAGLQRRQPRSASPAPSQFSGTPVRMSTDVPGYSAGHRVASAEEFGRALRERHHVLSNTPLDGRRYTVMTAERDFAPGTAIRHGAGPEEVTNALEEAVRVHQARVDDSVRHALVASAAGEDVRLAAGGPCAPRTRRSTCRSWRRTPARSPPPSRAPGSPAAPRRSSARSATPAAPRGRSRTGPHVGSPNVDSRGGQLHQRRRGQAHHRLRHPRRARPSSA